MTAASKHFTEHMKRAHGITVNFHGENPATSGVTQEYWRIWRTAWKLSREISRTVAIEDCAKVCDGIYDHGIDQRGAKDCAAAIRNMRGE